MIKKNKEYTQTTNWIRWIARIWSLPILFYTVLILIGSGWSWVTTGVADPNVIEDVPFLEVLPVILMFLSIMGLGIAWRWERPGGAISIIFQLATVIVLMIQRPITEDFSRSLVPYLLSIVVVIPGIFFLVCFHR